MSETYNLFKQGRAHLAEGMAAQATVPLEKAKKREPDKASIREALGIAYFRIRRYDAAEAELRAMLELSPADDYAHYALGRCLEKRGKVARLRIFEGDSGRFERSLLETGDSALVVSQFTLIADTRKGTRPSFSDAAPPEEAEPIYERFCSALADEGVSVERGVFGARMA